MKTLTLILTFLPLIVFSVLARLLPHHYIGVAGLTAAVIALIAIATSHLPGHRRSSTPAPWSCSR